jgi:hypothetical protein
MGLQTWVDGLSEGEEADFAGWLTAGNIPAPDMWHHLVYVYDGATNLSVYVDGALRLDATFSNGLRTATNAPLLVGLTCDTSGAFYHPWYGYINAIRIHGGVLSSNQVLVNYLAGPCEGDCGPVTFAGEPSDIVAPEGSDGRLDMTPPGDGEFSFQWYRDGMALAGATNSICTLTNLQWADSGTQLYCVVSRLSPCAPAPVTSRSATVTVQPQLPQVSYPSALGTNELFCFEASLKPGGLFRVDYKNDLSEPAWTPLNSEFTASSAETLIIDPATYLTNHQRFYRVLRLK